MSGSASDADYVLRYVAANRAHAKFVTYSHSSEFIAEEAGLGSGFHYVSLYDEAIDANTIASRRGLILLQNSYLPSFAYNLALCWAYAARRRVPGGSRASLDSLLRYNFKKFYAEQLLRANPNLFSRAVFLETLLYDQSVIVPVFESKTLDATLDEDAQHASALMSSIVSFHELGHYLLKRDPAIFQDVLGTYDASVATIAERVLRNYPPAFAEEFKCDVLAISSCLTHHAAHIGRAPCLRFVVFGFAAFAVLSSLEKSAAATGDSQRANPDSIDLSSIERRHANFDYTVGRDLDFVERARLAAEFCGALLPSEGTELFVEDGAFPLPVTLLDDMLGFIESIMEQPDQNARKMSLLTAEAFHGDHAGFQYLVLRSKTFTRHDGTQVPRLFDAALASTQPF